MKTILLLAIAAVVSGLCSCNTTIGLGRDMRILGGNMEKAAQAKQGGGGGDDSSGAPVY